MVSQQPSCRGHVLPFDSGSCGRGRPAGAMRRNPARPQHLLLKKSCILLRSCRSLARFLGRLSHLRRGYHRRARPWSLRWRVLKNGHPWCQGTARCPEWPTWCRRPAPGHLTLRAGTRSEDCGGSAKGRAESKRLRSHRTRRGCHHDHAAGGLACALRLYLTCGAVSRCVAEASGAGRTCGASTSAHGTARATHCAARAVGNAGGPHSTCRASRRAHDEGPHGGPPRCTMLLRTIG
mmetsp:Transcript_54850/g.146428  ORF Transcript_54850/g.146428 Transcript_54850/m.146428 type:complete len:236 (+) Transcript_54850:500-1207(+)